MDNTKNEYIVGENQQERYYFFIDEHNYSKNIYLRFCVERNATLSVEFFISRKNLEMTIDCVLKGEGADARIVGAYVANTFHTVKIMSMQHHYAARTRSVVVVKGALCDDAYTHYQGTIRIEKNAYDAYASQENKNIVLGKRARAISVPNLEVLNHNVKCFHGSAAGKFDEEQLFYAASRGMNKEVAQRLLLQAFFAELFTDRALNEHVCTLIG